MNDNQTACIKARFITKGVNARPFQDFFDFCSAQNRNGILLFLDFEKTFDSVKWKILYKIIKKFSIGYNYGPARPGPFYEIRI